MTDVRRIDAVTAHVTSSTAPPLASEGLVSIGIVTLARGDRFVSVLAIAPDGSAHAARLSPRRVAALIGALTVAAVKAWGTAWTTAPRRGRDPLRPFEDGADASEESDSWR